jgi:hypothetical protein
MSYLHPDPEVVHAFKFLHHLNEDKELLFNVLALVKAENDLANNLAIAKKEAKLQEGGADEQNALLQKYSVEDISRFTGVPACEVIRLFSDSPTIRPRLPGFLQPRPKEAVHGPNPDGGGPKEPLVDAEPAEQWRRAELRGGKPKSWLFTWLSSSLKGGKSREVMMSDKHSDAEIVQYRECLRNLKKDKMLLSKVLEFEESENDLADRFSIALEGLALKVQSDVVKKLLLKKYSVEDISTVTGIPQELRI